MGLLQESGVSLSGWSNSFETRSYCQEGNYYRDGWLEERRYYLQSQLDRSQ